MLLKFIDLEIIKAMAFFMMTFSLFVLSLRRAKDADLFPQWAKRTLIITILLPFIAAAIEMSSAKESMKLFLDDKSLVCKVEHHKYSVSKNSGWKIDDIYFSKDSLLIRGDRCEEFK